MQVYTAFDKAVGAYLPPFFCRSRGEAMRSFIDACQEKGHQFNKHPEDFELFYLGEFDDSVGSFNCELPQHIMSGMNASAINA